MNSRAITLFTDAGTSMDTLGRWDPPGERTRFKVCAVGHPNYSVEASECPACRLARQTEIERAETRRVLAAPRKCGCGCGAPLPEGGHALQKYLNATHAKRQFNRGLRSAEKRLRGMA
jgi:hypothetical protein